LHESTRTGWPNVAERPPVPFRLGDVVCLKRPHPCGGSTWLIDRLGADLGLRCTTCARHVLLDRPAVERRLAGFEVRGDAALSAAVVPAARHEAP
jgi:hypothetical protein